MPVKVGPLDPDVTSDFGQVAAKSTARQLIRLHSQAHPPQLVQALARPLDAPRTKGLSLDEVREYLAGEELENGDPLVPEGATVVGASVRGSADSEQVLCFTYRLPSGRTGKWHASYNGDVLPESYDAGSELTRVHEMKERGVVAFDSEATHAEILRRENSGLRREVQALRAQFEGRDTGELPEGTPGDTRPDVGVVEDNERLGRENAEMKARLAQFESLQAAGEGHVSTSGIAELARDRVASADPPVDGYEDMKADEVAKLLKDDDTDTATRQRVLDYERAHANRKSVVGAAEESLGARG